MARFYPLYVRRSDGKLEVAAKAKRAEENQPTADQLDQKPDKNGVSDFYREVVSDEAKHIDWRRKLGGMLARELNWKDKSGGDSGYILVAFPHNYRLYEHVKKTERDGKLEVKSKTHAAGGNDRQDAYLYGHPMGRKKRFRSPNDFFPHLLWLCTDESGDPDNCSCKICSPEDLENILPGVKVRQDPGSRPISSAQVQPMSRTTSAQSSRPKQEPRQPVAPLNPEPAPARKPVAAPLPAPKTIDQKTDQTYGAFMYRSGELVWFRRGQAWGLGAILRRWSSKDVSATTTYFYSVQPLSYPFEHPAPVVKSSDVELRPWLAWSVPKFTNDGLNQLSDPISYDTADWQGMLQRQYGNGDMEVDGSILAAKTVDSTYTLFGKNDTVETQPGLIETHYDGVFLGAEKVWVGDPIRLAIGSGTDIMVIHSIIEQKKVAAMAQHAVSTSLRFLGDIYTLSHVSHNNPQIPTPAAPNNNPHLPVRLTEDLNYRNARSISLRRTASYWKLLLTQHPVDVDVVKGRWYEASLILPILHPQQFEEALRKGEIQESSLWMNSRGDCVNANRPPTFPRLPRGNIFKQSRREAFGRALPPNAQITDGIAPPSPPPLNNIDPALSTSNNAMEVDPRFDTAEHTRPDAPHHNPAGGLDEFMNLDGMDEGAGMPDFEQDFGEQTSNSFF